MKVPIVIVLNIIMPAYLCEVVVDSLNQFDGHATDNLAVGSIVQELRLINHVIIFVIGVPQEIIIVDNVKMGFSRKGIYAASVILCHDIFY